MLIVLFCYIYCIYRGPEPIIWDEYMHWAPMLKTLFYCNDFYINEDSYLYMHNDYPPIVPIYESIPLVFSPKYNLQLSFEAIVLFQLSVFLILVPEKIDKQTTKNCLLLILVTNLLIIAWFINLFLLSIDNVNFGKLDIDSILALCTGYGLYFILIDWNTKSYWISNTIINMFLILIKANSFIFSFVILSTLLLRLIFTTYKKGFKITINKWLFSFTLIVIVIATYFSWKITYDFSFAAHNTWTQFNIWETTENNNFFQLNTNEKITVLKNYIFSICFQGLVVLKIYSISLAGIIIINLAVCWLMLKTKRTLLFFVLYEIISLTIVYLGSLGFAYMFMFGYIDSTRLQSIERYMSVYIIAIALFLLIIFIYKTNYLNWNIQSYKIICCCLLCFVVIFPGNISFWSRGNSESDKYINYANEITEKVPYGSDVLVYDSSTTLDYTQNNKWNSNNIDIRCTIWATQYYLDKTHLTFMFAEGNFEGYSVRQGELCVKMSPADNYFPDSETSKKIIQKQDYVYIKNSSEKFNELLNNISNIQVESSSLYKVEKLSDGNFNLLKI